MPSIVDRALSALGTCDYKLGHGGFSAVSKFPGARWQDPKTGLSRVSCDCSGFVAWCLMRSRRSSKQFAWWLSTDSIWSDAKGTLKKKRGEIRLFKEVPIEEAKPGDLVVYPDRYAPSGKKLGEGHVAVLVDVQERTIIDCSYSRNGITRRAGTPFFDMNAPGKPLKNTAKQIVCRYNADGWKD